MRFADGQVEGLYWMMPEEPVLEVLEQKWKRKMYFVVWMAVDDENANEDP
jgi:cation transport regulator ChaC